MTVRLKTFQRVLTGISDSDIMIFNMIELGCLRFLIRRLLFSIKRDAWRFKTHYPKTEDGCDRFANEQKNDPYTGRGSGYFM